MSPIPNPICIAFPAMCEQAEALQGFLDFFSGNGAEAALQSALAEVQATREFDLRLAAFVEIYRNTFGFVVVLALVVLVINLARQIISNSRSDDWSFGFVPFFKVFLVGMFLPAAVMMLMFLSQTVTQMVNSLLAVNFFPPWVDSLQQGFILTGFITRVAGAVLAFILSLQLTILQFLAPIAILFGLISFGLTAFRSNYSMGKPSRWAWSLLLTALFLKPALVLVLGLGGIVIQMFNLSESVRAGAVLVLLTVSTFLWWPFFKAFNRKIEAAVNNRVEIRGTVTNRQVGGSTAASTRAADRARNINRSHPVRNTAVDLGAARVGKAALAAPHPAAKAAGVAIMLGHAWLKSRR